MANLWTGERLLASWTAVTTDSKGWVSRTNGSLLLTDQRVIFDPMQLGGPFVVKLVNTFTSLDEHYMALADIVEVSATSGFGGSPLMRVRLTNGQSRCYCVLARLWNSSNKKNRPVRDDAVARIDYAARAAR